MGDTEEKVKALYIAMAFKPTFSTEEHFYPKLNFVPTTDNPLTYEPRAVNKGQICGLY